MINILYDTVHKGYSVIILVPKDLTADHVRGMPEVQEKVTFEKI